MVYPLDTTVICVPYHTDIARWAAAEGPAAYLRAGLLEQLEADGHHVNEPVWIDLPLDERTSDSVANVSSIARRTSEQVSQALSRHRNAFVVGLVGDCTHAVGLLGGLHASSGEAPGITWFDGHGDICTRATTTSGYLGGMGLAVALGWDHEDWRRAAGLRCPVRAETTALLGTSDLDPPELVALAECPAITHMTAAELSADGAIERLGQQISARARLAPLWQIHVDVDVAGPNEVPGCMTPTPTWPRREHLVDATAEVARVAPVACLSLASYNPSGDPEGRGVLLGLDVVRAVTAAAARRRAVAPAMAWESP